MGTPSHCNRGASTLKGTRTGTPTFTPMTTGMTRGMTTGMTTGMTPARKPRLRRKKGGGGRSMVRGGGEGLGLGLWTPIEPIPENKREGFDQSQTLSSPAPLLHLLISRLLFLSPFPIHPVLPSFPDPHPHPPSHRPGSPPHLHPQPQPRLFKSRQIPKPTSGLFRGFPIPRLMHLPNRFSSAVQPLALSLRQAPFPDIYRSGGAVYIDTQHHPSSSYLSSSPSTTHTPTHPIHILNHIVNHARPFKIRPKET